MSELPCRNKPGALCRAPERKRLSVGRGPAEDRHTDVGVRWSSLNGEDKTDGSWGRQAEETRADGGDTWVIYEPEAGGDLEEEGSKVEGGEAD